MNTQDFVDLYKKQESDESLTPFNNEIGFSLVRLYPKDTAYYNNNLRMFIKVALLEQGLFYGVDMTKPENEGNKISYIIVEDKEHKNKTTNFTSIVGDKEFVFDKSKNKIVHTKTRKEFDLNEFIKILVKNHLSDRMYWKRKLNFIVNLILKTIFWLADKHYEKVQVLIDKYHFSKENKTATEEKESFEPFFKYFYISRNFIFTILLVTFIVAIISSIFPRALPFKHVWGVLFGDFSLSNPFVVLLIVLVLFSAEKLSKWLVNKIKNFLEPNTNHFSEKEENFIEKLHNYQYHNSFNLKL